MVTLSVGFRYEAFGLAGGGELRVGDDIGVEKVAETVVAFISRDGAGGGALAAEKIVISVRAYGEFSCGAWEGVVKD